ncbi:MAG TPA: TIGR03557 family F420-dependent LLM class oxidoreductase [Gaiellaceae bacterium]|nr:TIGR03557 family F420-dependent LLM class oxidoreductase [Gaiellaceae bacterium]
MPLRDLLRRRPDGPVEYRCALAHERFQPPDLLEQARAAEQAGFDGICCSDHLAPWWTEKAAPTASGNAWVWLGAVARETGRAKLGTAVTPIVHRYNPVVVAQQVATLELLAPGRVFVGVGSGEAMNEVPAGMRWPSPAEQLERTEEALSIITRLLDGDTVYLDGRHFRATGAYLYSRPERRPPVYLSAFHEGAAKLAGRLADGIWTLGDPRSAPKIVEAYKESCEEAGRKPGEIIVHGVFSYAATDEQALESAREWKGTMVDAHYTDDVHDPEQIHRNGEEQVSDEAFTKQVICSSDPDHHVTRIKALEKLGATVVALMNVSGADPHAALRVYGERVLPQLRG